MKTRSGKQETQPHDWRKKMIIDINGELFSVNFESEADDKAFRLSVSLSGNFNKCARGRKEFGLLCTFKMRPHDHYG